MAFIAGGNLKQSAWPINYAPLVRHLSATQAPLAVQGFSHMRLSLASFDGRGLAKRLQRLRQRPYLAYGIAIAAAAVATLIRILIDEYLPGGLPFITYFGAVAAATALGGFGPGVAAVLLSAIVAWVLFLDPPVQTVLTQAQVLALSVFIPFRCCWLPLLLRCIAPSTAPQPWSKVSKPK